MATSNPIRLCRSLLYMPGSNARAMEKASALQADSLIFDLEDAVSPDKKSEAREMVAAAVTTNSYGNREVLVRINSTDTDWAEDDIRKVAPLPIDGLVIPKVQNAEVLQATIRSINTIAEKPLPVWIMTETPRGVLEADTIYGCSDQIEGIILGTSDLAKELRIPHTPERTGFQHLLSHCVIAARAYGLDIIDGVHLNFRDLDEFRNHCQQGRDLGFDGKSLIHPSQIDICNSVFSPTEDNVAQAAEIVDAWDAAIASGNGVCVINGRLIENLHVEEAQRTLALAEAIKARSAG